MAKHQNHLEKRQMLLGRLMEIGTDLFAMAATCSYALSLKGTQEMEDSPLALAHFFCRITRRRISANFRALSHNDDREANALAKNVIDKSYRWLENGIVWMGPDE